MRGVSRLMSDEKLHVLLIFGALVALVLVIVIRSLD